MDTLDELYEKAINGELKPVETKANIFDTLEEPKTSKELDLNKYKFYSNNDNTKKQVISIIDDEFDKLIEGFEELNLKSNELYLIEKAKANIAIRLFGINFTEKVYVPICPPAYPYAPLPGEPTVIKPIWEYEYTDKTINKE